MQPRNPLTPTLPMTPHFARCPLTLPSPPVGERVAEGRVRGFGGPMREVLIRGILTPSEGERQNSSARLINLGAGFAGRPLNQPGSSDCYSLSPSDGERVRVRGFST